MPYLSKEAQETLLNSSGISEPGELNFLITKLCIEFAGKEPRYQDYNAVIGALECAKLELYRRAVAPYEDKKIVENGDVY